MGRRPIGKKAMTPAQRQRLRRARIKRQAKGTAVPRRKEGTDWGQNTEGALREYIDGVRVTRLPRPWKEDTLNANLKEATQIVLGCGASSDFVDALKTEAEKVAWIRLAEEEAPRAAAWKTWSKKWRKHVTALMEMNEGHNDGSNEHIRVLCAASGLDEAKISGALDVLATTVGKDEKLSRASAVDLTLKQISGTRGGPGPTRLLNVAQKMPGNSRAKLYCAQVVVEAWESTRGQVPDEKDSRAMAAAACLWQATGGQELPGAQRKAEVGAGWDYWIGMALQPEQRQLDFAADIRRNVSHVLKGAGE